MKTLTRLALPALLAAAPLASAAPLIETVVTVDQLNASGVAGGNAVPVFGRYDGTDALFLNRPAGDRLLRASAGGGVAVDVLFGTTPAPDTGNAVGFGTDWGFLPGGGPAFVLGASRVTEPDGAATGGVYTHAAASDPLATFVSELGGGLPALPRRYAFGDGPVSSGFVLGDRAGTDEGAYLRTAGVTRRIASVGDAYANAAGVTARFFDGNRYDVGGRTLAMLIEGSDNRTRLTTATNGALRSLLAADDVITDATGDRLRVNFFNGLVAEGTSAYARLSVEDLDAPFRDDEREALVRVDLVTGAIEVIDRTTAGRIPQIGGGFDFLRGGLAVDDGVVAYQRTADGVKDIFFADANGAQRLLGVGDDFLGGVLTDLDFIDGSFSNGRLLFTGQYQLSDGSFQTGLFTAAVPEPASGLVLVTLVAVAGRRRRVG